jgi:hypothetical protein
LATLSTRLAVVIAVLAALAAAAPATHASTPPQFRADTVLPGSNGAEPSIAVDTSPTATRNNIYVSAISPGANLWHSYDGGQTWSAPVPFDANGPSRGGDADVTVSDNGTVVVADLNIAYTQVQTSTDQGKTFSAGTTGVTTPESDRPWLTAGAGSNLYVSYHDFAGETIQVCPSTDLGTTFLPCRIAEGPNDPTIPLNCAENTDIGRSLRVDPVDSSLNLVFSCSTTAQNAANPPYGPVTNYYMSKSTDGGITWTSYPMFAADTSGGKAPAMSNFWTSFVIDSAGNYYALMDGTFDDLTVPANPYHVFLLTSTNHGVTWSAPKIVDHETDGKGTHVLSDIAVSTPGQADIVWYGTTATGEPNGVCGNTAAQGPCPNNEGLPIDTAAGAPPWRVSMAQTFNALDTTPSFTQTPVTTEATHFGEVCTNGLVCGSSDRSLLDYISIALDCRGNAHVAFAGNPTESTGGPTTAREADQVGGSTIAAPAACGAPVGGSVAETPWAPLLPAAGVGIVVALGARRVGRRHQAA